MFSQYWSSLLHISRSALKETETEAKNLFCKTFYLLYISKRAASVPSPGYTASPVLVLDSRRLTFNLWSCIQIWSRNKDRKAEFSLGESLTFINEDCSRRWSGSEPFITTPRTWFDSAEGRALFQSLAIKYSELNLVCFYMILLETSSRELAGGLKKICPEAA